MELEFKITDERMLDLTMDAICAYENWANGIDGDMRATRELVSTFMVDAEGQYLDEEIALRIVGRIKQRDFVDKIFKPFFDAFRDHLVPKASGDSSSSPSTTTEALPGGSES